MTEITAKIVGLRPVFAVWIDLLYKHLKHKAAWEQFGLMVSYKT